MNSIYFKENVYFLVQSEYENDLYVFHEDYKQEASLYGGRVNIDYSGYSSKNYLTVDGIQIFRINHNNFAHDLSNSEIVSHLNSIETNGTDAFIENYKKSVEFLYEELKELKNSTGFLMTSEQNESRLRSLLNDLERIRTLLLSVIAILFSLKTHMAASLENEKVLTVYQSLIDSLS